VEPTVQVERAAQVAQVVLLVEPVQAEQAAAAEAEVQVVQAEPTVQVEPAAAVDRAEPTVLTVRVAQAVLLVEPVQVAQAAAVDRAEPTEPTVQVAQAAAVAPAEHQEHREQPEPAVQAEAAVPEPSLAAQQIMLQNLPMEQQYQIVNYMTMLQMLVLVQRVQCQNLRSNSLVLGGIMG
jgi:hypothetical protein